MGIIWILCGYHLARPGAGMVSSCFPHALGIVNECTGIKKSAEALYEMTTRSKVLTRDLS